MNRYDETHIFRMAKISDVEDIMNFFKTEWGENHILANDKEFFLYEFQQGKDINFLLAIDKKTGIIDVTYGFIKNTEEIIPNVTDVYGVMFKARNSCKIPFIGIETLKRLKDFVPYRTFTSNGVNPRTSMVLQEKILKQKTGRLKHFYRLNENIESYNIAGIENKEIVPIESKTQKSVKEIFSANELFEVFNPEDYINQIPYKDKWYIEKRYFKHPIYNYRVFSIGDDRDKCIFCGREISVNGAKIMRIVDILGTYNEFRYCGNALDKLIKENEYEYIDFYEHGLDNGIQIDAGFIERKQDDINIIPNYFEPFVRQNVEIYYSITNPEIIITKSDGDQDRPNYRKNRKE